jgi:PTS system glucose-specific IIA component
MCWPKTSRISSDDRCGVAVSLVVVSPVTGTVVGLVGVPDPVFASAMVGPGSAVDPALTPGFVCSPVAGVLRKLKPHAFIVVTPLGHGVLVHLGIDTIGLDGLGFTLAVGEGAFVEAGEPIVGWDPSAIASQGLSPICPVVALDTTGESLSGHAPVGPIKTGDPLFVWE